MNEQRSLQVTSKNTCYNIIKYSSNGIKEKHNAIKLCEIYFWGGANMHRSRDRPT